jgi:hypothetical protein
MPARERSSPAKCDQAGANAAGVLCDAARTGTGVCCTRNVPRRLRRQEQAGDSADCYSRGVDACSHVWVRIIATSGGFSSVPHVMGGNRHEVGTFTA